MSVTLMSVTQRLATRRNFMRGMLGGAAINVALPFLDCFLNANGTALHAASEGCWAAFTSTYTVTANMSISGPCCHSARLPVDQAAVP